MPILKILLTIVFVSIALPLVGQADAQTPNDVTKNSAPLAIKPWQEVVVSVSNIDQTARFFTEIGGYQTVWQGSMSADELAAWGLPDGASAHALVLKQANRSEGYIRLVNFKDTGPKVPTRPGARAWDTGCYFSLMVRMKDMSAVYDDAIKMGWWTETPITELQFGKSHLNIVIFKGPDGIQVQSYERLNRPIPATFPDFERFSAPFNLMQMVRDKNQTMAFYKNVLGFDVFFDGPPTKSEKPVNMPLGIPKSLTTEVAYHAGIVYPTAGPVGRLESIEIIDIDGNDYASRCHAPNLGILAVRFEVPNVDATVAKLAEQDYLVTAKSANISPYGNVNLINLKSPDGANLQFYQVQN